MVSPQWMKTSGCARAHRVVEPQAAPLRVDAPALADGVGRPGDGDVARRVRAAACAKLPVSGSLHVRRSDEILEAARDRRCAGPAGRSRSTTRAVKSVGSSAAGPTTRRGSAKLSVVAYSTTIRAGRSVRLQMTARPAVTSPAATPCGIAGRGRVGLDDRGRLPDAQPSRRSRCRRGPAIAAHASAAGDRAASPIDRPTSLT